MLKYRVVRANNIWEFCEKVLFSKDCGGYSKLYTGDISIKQIEVASIRGRNESRLYRVEISKYLGENLDDKILHEYLEKVIFPIARSNDYYFSPFYGEYYQDIDGPGYVYFARKPKQKDVESHVFGVKIYLEKYVDNNDAEKEGYFIDFVFYDEKSSEVIAEILSTMGIPTKPYRVVF